MKTKIGLITTTINVPHVLEKHAANVPDDCTLEIVVAGDVQTPLEARTLVKDLGGTYLSIADHLTTRWESESFIGTRTIQRRNLALLHAITLGCDVIVTIDDDNRPLDGDYLHDFVTGLRKPIEELTSTSTDWFNPGELLYPRVTHRGFPLSRRHDSYVKESVTPDPTTHARVGVVAGLCIGNPDIDAIERIANQPIVKDVTGLTYNPDHGVVLAAGTWAPFNTQNTAYSWDVAPLMQCLVDVGRYDDIWMSYVARRVMDAFGYHVRYALPIAIQDRNVHNLLNDLDAEMHGYRHTDLFTDTLRDIGGRSATDGGMLQLLRRVYDAVADANIISDRTRNANSAWLTDVRRAVADGQKHRNNVPSE